MSEYEMLQYAALGAGAVVFALSVFGLGRYFVRQGRIFPDAARDYGLAYTHEKKGSPLTNIHDVQRLQGEVDGTPLHVAATYETRGRTTMRSTWMASRAPAGWLPCTVNVARTPPAAKVHHVPTGDATFDRRRWVTCGTPAMAQAMLTPDVRAKLLRCPQHEIRLVVHDGNVVLSFGGTPFNAVELRGPIDAVLALARTGAA